MSQLSLGNLSHCSAHLQKKKSKKKKKASGEDMLWYKQTPGQMPQDIRMQGAWMDATIIFPAFKKFGFKVERTKRSIFLHIPNATTDDEGSYYYGMLLSNKITFSTGTFLTVSVVQSPVLGRVPPGESVFLQCTVLSERRTVELRVLWFRAAAGVSHPEIIYTHHNNSHQCEISSSPNSCVYSLSKSVFNLSDTGTYYCAVATCGKILLGNGTTMIILYYLDHQPKYVYVYYKCRWYYFWLYICRMQIILLFVNLLNAFIYLHM
uniref:Ig-like domain-containing protein n=1 Tax=Electrophorus electricus TaxID=8005 RepID=A0AAY5EIH4_ELEEL